MSGPGRPRPPAGTSRYTWVVGVAALLALAYITLNTLGTDAPGSRGVAERRAAAAVRGPARALEPRGRRAGRSRQGVRVRGPRVLNSCQLAERGPVAIAFFAIRSKRCERQIDVARAGAPQLPRRRRRRRVGARRARARCAASVRQHGWGMPVGYDHDGAVTNAYAVAICPTITFAAARRQGGGDVVLAARRGARWPSGWRRCGERGRRPAGSTRSSPPSSPSCACTRSRSPRARAAARPSCASGCGELSDRFRGPQAVVMRQRPVPWAYRVFFRHIGLDPDEHRTPVEALALERLKAGGFRSRSLLDDALTIAVMETGVPVWALDADRVEGDLGLRPAARGERFGSGEYASDIPVGRLLVADDAGPVGVLFGALAPGRGVGAGDDADDAVLGPGGRASRTSTSRRRCGRSPTSLTVRLDRAPGRRRKSRDGRPPRARPRRRCARSATAWSTCWWSTSPASATSPPLTPRLARGDARAPARPGAARPARTSTRCSRTLERDVLAYRGRVDHPAYFAFIPGSSTWPGALGDFLASALQRLRRLAGWSPRARARSSCRCSTGSRSGSATRRRAAGILLERRVGREHDGARVRARDARRGDARRPRRLRLRPGALLARRAPRARSASGPTR